MNKWVNPALCPWLSAKAGKAGPEKGARLCIILPVHLAAMMTPGARPRASRQANAQSLGQLGVDQRHEPLLRNPPQGLGLRVGSQPGFPRVARGCRLCPR